MLCARRTRRLLVGESFFSFWFWVLLSVVYEFGLGMVCEGLGAGGGVVAGLRMVMVACGLGWGEA
jgi:hypothetical protein